MSIKRVWHGWTTLENADKYQDILMNEVIPGIEAKKIPGYRGIEVLRTEHEDEVEFVTMMIYDSLEDVKGLQGDDYKKCYVPDIAQAVLKRWDQEAAHYEIVDTTMC
jgi:antibiotic biosynthesis monooxygenase (ABM) superfamily enzyme